MAEQFFLAVDGGGSKTHVVCADAQGTVMGEGYSGPTSLTATTVGAASFNLKEAVRQAVEKLPADTEIKALVMGLAGMDTEEEAVVAEQVFSQALSEIRIGLFTLVNDIEIAIANGTDDVNALALIAGTGSNCFGRNQAGQTARAGGMDYLLTDQGSGYAIGHSALRAAVKSFDGRGQKTVLEQLVCEHFHIESIAHLKPKIHNPMITKTEVAELAQLCLRAYDSNDRIARLIFERAVADLIDMATAVINRLELQQSPATVVLAGSITKILFFEHELNNRLHALFPQLKLVVPDKPPVFGALKMALLQAKK